MDETQGWAGLMLALLLRAPEPLLPLTLLARAGRGAPLLWPPSMPSLDHLLFHGRYPAGVSKQMDQ